jgi:hypothetical protein
MDPGGVGEEPARPDRLEMKGPLMDVVSSIYFSSLTGAILFFAGGRYSARAGAPPADLTAELTGERERRLRAERDAVEAWQAQRETARAAEEGAAEIASLRRAVMEERAAREGVEQRDAAELGRLRDDAARLRTQAAALAEEVTGLRAQPRAAPAKPAIDPAANAAHARAAAAEKRVAALAADLGKARAELGQANAAKAKAMEREAALLARVEELTATAREVEELRHRVAELSAQGFATRLSEPPPPSRPPPEGASLGTVLERELGRLVDREDGCRLAVLADPRGLLIASSPGAAYPHEVAAASSLTTYASDRLRELLPLGAPASLELYDDNGLCVRTRWLRVDGECFLVSTVGVVDTHDPEAQMLTARLGDLIGSPAGGDRA